MAIRISRNRLDMDDKPIENLQEPLDDQDAATKEYADDPDTKGLIRGINEQTETSYTLVLDDRGKMVRLTNADGITLTVPDNDSVEFPIGTEIIIMQGGEGQITIEGDTSSVIRSEGGDDKTAGQYAGAFLTKIDTDEWLLEGNITHSF